GTAAGCSEGRGCPACDGPEEKAKFWSAPLPEDERGDFGWPGLMRAPLIVVPLSHKQGSLDRYAESDKGWTDKSELHWPVPYWHIDTGFAAMLMLLTAVDAGLGALFFGIFPERMPNFRRAFGVPDAYTPIGAITFGYPAPDTPSPSLKRGRRGVDAVMHRGQW